MGKVKNNGRAQRRSGALDRPQGANKKKQEMAKMAVDDFMEHGLSSSDENDESRPGVSVDEFMEHGLSSSDENNSSSPAETPAPAKKPKTKKNAKLEQTKGKQKSGKRKQAAEEEVDSESEIEDEEQMAQDMEQLKYTDPEFYAFLKQDEPSLLEFAPSEPADDDEEDSGDEDDEDEDGEEDLSDGEGEEDEEGSEEEEGEELGEDSEGSGFDEEEDEFGLGEVKGQKVVTREMVQDLEHRVFEKHSVEALKQLLEAFRCAVHMSDEPDEDVDGGKKGKKKAMHDARFRRYKFENSGVFNSLVVLCLRRMQEALDYHLHLADQKPGKRMTLPTRSKQWRKHKNIVRGYVANLLHFTRQLVEPTMLGYVLKAVERMAPYFAAFPKIGRGLLKSCVDIWGKGEEHVRVMAFLVVRKLSVVAPKTFLDVAVRALYMMYVKNAKFTTAQSQPTLTFMENCVVEICGLDHFITYTNAFTYVRQLAIHLRTAMTTRKKDAFASVYNWQYLHCLQVWARVVSEHYSPTLAPLTYPLTQILIGTIRMVPTARYFPLRLHCVRALNMLARSTRTFVPVAPFVLEVLDSQHVKGAPKRAVTKPPLFPYIYKVSKSTLGSKAFQEGCVDQVVGLLLEHMAIYSTHIAFPEYAVPTVVQLRKFLSTCKNGKVKAQLKQILDKAKENIRFIVDRRQGVTFSPRDARAVVEWNRRITEEAKTPLVLYSASWAKIEKARQAAFEANRVQQGGDDDESSESDMDMEQVGGDEEEDELSDLEEDFDAPKKSSKNTPKQQSAAKNKTVFNSDDEEAEDEVGDLVLSDME